MPGILGCQGSRTALLLALCAATAGCEPFEDTRIAAPRGTLGEEIYKIACERIASEQFPDDVSGRESDELCRGAADPSTAPDGTRLRALAENRERLVEALDRMLPADLEDELQTLLVSMLPFYDPPSELLPRNTRAIGRLLADLMEDDDVKAVLGRFSQRRGMREPRQALGLARALLAYPALPDLTETALANVDDGGPLESEWGALLEAAALEMATAEPTDPSDPTLGLVRDLLLRTDDAFGGTTPRYVVARDPRGLPVPAAIDGSLGFVDTDTDGLADVDASGRFVAADGSPLNPATPFPTLGESGVARDELGRALTDAMTPLYEYVDVERTMLAGLLREGPALLEPADPILIDLAYGMLPLLGPDAGGTETYGAVDLAYDGFDTDAAAMYDLVHAGAELLTHPETRDALSLAAILLADHEEDIVPLIESGFFGDALGDATPGADLAPGSELWDDVLQVVASMSEVPGMTEAVLRSFADPRTRRLGQIYAELIRFEDVPALDAGDFNVPLTNQSWSQPVDRTQPDDGANQSLFQQTLSIIHELNEAETCNKDGARMFLTLCRAPTAVFCPNEDWRIDITVLAGGTSDGWDRCELFRVPNTTELFVQSILGTADIPLDLPIGTILAGIADFLDFFGVDAGSITVDGIMERESGIDGFTTHPTPQSLARLVYGPWNDWMTGLIERPATIDGERVDLRYPGKPILAWERVFRFCGDRLLDAGETCSGTVTNMSFYDAMTPLLEVFDTYYPDDGSPYLFGELIGALHTHYPTSANAMYQASADAPHYARPDGGVTYEPIVSELLADCAWTAPGGGARTCTVENTGRLVTRLARATALLDTIEVRPGVDGIDVLAAATERLVSPTLNPDLEDRAGETETTTNAGSRTIANTPIYLLLDALAAMDAAHETDAARNEAWLAARSRLIDILLGTEPLEDDEFRLANRRVLAIARLVVDFTAEQIDTHDTDGDLVDWARALDDDLVDVLGGAMGSRIVRFLDALNGQPATQEAFLELVQYLLDEASPNDAFHNLLIGSADLLYLLDDDENMVTLINAVADAAASNARGAVAGDGSVEVEGAIVDETVSLLHETSQVDTAHTLTTVLARGVTHPDGEDETPLEVVLDVIAEVNRATPNEGGPLAPDDHGAVMGQVVDFLTDEERGLERVYDVVQNRVLP